MFFYLFFFPCSEHRKADLELGEYCKKFLHKYFLVGVFKLTCFRHTCSLRKFTKLDKLEKPRRWVVKKKRAMVFVLLVAECRLCFVSTTKGPEELCCPTGLLCFEWISTDFVLPFCKDSSKLIYWQLYTNTTTAC